MASQAGFPFFLPLRRELTKGDDALQSSNICILIYDRCCAVSSAQARLLNRVFLPAKVRISSQDDDLHASCSSYQEGEISVCEATPVATRGGSKVAPQRSHSGGVAQRVAAQLDISVFLMWLFVRK